MTKIVLLLAHWLNIVASVGSVAHTGCHCWLSAHWLCNRKPRSDWGQMMCFVRNVRLVLLVIIDKFVLRVNQIYFDVIGFTFSPIF